MTEVCEGCLEKRRLANETEAKGSARTRVIEPGHA